MIDLEEKVYEIREYGKFPIKGFFSDKFVKTYVKQEDAMYDSRVLNKKHENKRFYVIDNPHEWITLTRKEKLTLKEKYGLI